VALRAAVESEVASQARLREERDISTRQRTRIFVFSLVMAIWTLLPLLGWGLGIHTTRGWLLSTHAGMTLLSLFLVIWARDSLSRSELNRRIAASLIAVHLALVLADLLAHPLNMNAGQIVMLNQLVLALMAGLTALTTDRRALLPTAGYLVAMVGSVFWPAAMQALMALSNLLVAVVAFVVWTPEGVESLRRREE
jgi:serine/threonine-protein kinase